jgi:thioredoxin-like negative regulator of GroEL
VTERLAIVLVVLAVGALLLLAARIYLGWRRSRAMIPTGAGALAGVPTLVYLYAAQCSVCPQQARVVDTLAARHPQGLNVLRVDALAQPDLADGYGIWTVPATIVTDAAGRTVAVNCGLASASKLERQLALASGGASGARSLSASARAA